MHLEAYQWIRSSMNRLSTVLLSSGSGSPHSSASYRYSCTIYDPSRVTIVIPAFNEEKTIVEVINAAKKFGEIVVVNDGSTDSTKTLAKNAGVKVISHERNMGYTSAVRTGIKNSTRDIIVLLDADMQQVPEEIPNLVLPILENKADLVIGSKFLGRLEYRPNVPNFLMDKLVSTVLRFRFGVKLTNSYSGFRAMRRDLIDLEFLKGNRQEGTLELNYFFAKSHSRIIEVPRTARKRIAGQSSVRAFDGVRILERLLILLLSPNNDNSRG